MRPVNNRNIHNSLLTIFGVLFAGGGAYLFIYLWIELTVHGIQADELHISGRITDLEIGAAILIVAFIISSIVCFRQIKDMSNSYKRKLLVATVTVVVSVVLLLIAQSFTYR